MAKGVNKVFLLGHVGKEPEIRTTNGGMTIASFTVATADRQKDAQGDWQDKTEWHNMVAFQRTAEIVRDYVKKGTQLFIEGKIQTRSWEDKESGQKRYKTEILVNELSLLGKPGGSEGSQGSQRSSTNAAPTGGGYASEEGMGITDDDIPFVRWATGSYCFAGRRPCKSGRLFSCFKNNSNTKENRTMYTLFIPSAVAFVFIAVTQVVSELRGAAVSNI